MKSGTCAGSPLFGSGRGRKEVVGLIARALRVGKAAGGDEVRNDGELLDQIVIELAAALIRGKLLVAIGRRFVSVPTDQHGARLFLAMKTQQQIGEAKDRAGRPVAVLADILRQRVIGAVRKGVAVDHQ
jgi:hypothetical protein